MSLQTIQLSPTVYQTVINWANREKITPNQLIERLLVERQPIETTSTTRRRKIRQELQAFEQQHADLLRIYQGQYVAMHQGQVIDHDNDLRILHQRLFAQLGHIPVLLKQVTADSQRELVFRSPRFERRQP